MNAIDARFALADIDYLNVSYERIATDNGHHGDQAECADLASALIWAAATLTAACRDLFAPVD